MGVIHKTIIFLFILSFICNTLLGCGRGNVKQAFQPIGFAMVNPSSHRAVDYPSPPKMLADTGKTEQPERIVLPPGTKIATELDIPGWVRTWGADGNPDGLEFVNRVAVDNQGNVLVTGKFAGNIDFSAGTSRRFYETISNGFVDGFVSKWSSRGGFKWVRKIGGAGSDCSYDVAVDSDGNVYATGLFNKTVDFNTHYQDVDEHTSNGNADIFLTKYDNDGSYLWTRTWGTLGNDEGTSVTVDSSNNVYVTGSFVGSLDFDPGPNVANVEPVGDHDIFLLRLNSDGEFQWVRAWGGPNFDTSTAVRADDQDNLYVTGVFAGADVDFSAGQLLDGLHISSQGGVDIFLCKFSPDGDFIWAKTLGGSEDDRSYGLAVCPESGSVYISGNFKGAVTFPAGQWTKAFTRNSNGLTDAFICKYNSSGNFLWVRTYGGTWLDQCSGIGVDGSGNVYTAGHFGDTVNFGSSRVPDTRTAVRLRDCFLLKLDQDGKSLWTRTWGGNELDTAAGVAVDTLGRAFVGGVFGDSVNFAPIGFDKRTSLGKKDMFLCRFPPDGNWGTKIELKIIKGLKNLEP